MNGLRNGKGKEYDEDGKLEFEGEYLHGKRLKGKYHKFHIITPGTDQKFFLSRGR